MRISTLVLGGLVVIGVGCKELPSAPVFDSPVDPASEGDRQPAAPLDMTVAEASSESVSVRWLDVSTFETGYRIEVAAGDPSGAGPFAFGDYEVALELPPDATAATLPLSRDHNAYAIRVYGAGPDGLDGFRSATKYVLRMQGLPYRLRDGSALRTDINDVTFGPGADRVSFISPFGTAVSFDARTGEVPAALGFARPPLRGGSGIVLAQTDGGIVGFTGASVSRPFPNGSAESAVSLTGGRVAFRSGRTVRVETIPEAGEDPASVSTFEVSGQATSLALSPDGQTLYVAEGGRLHAYRADDGSPLWQARGADERDPVLSVTADGTRIGFSAGTRAGLISASGESLAEISIPRGGVFVAGGAAPVPAGVLMDEGRVVTYDLVGGALVARSGELAVIRDGVAIRLEAVDARPARSGRLRIAVATRLSPVSTAVGHQWVVGEGSLSAAREEEWLVLDEAP